ncbi:hypothetical protein PL9631_450082 [Planktothrix paucivesiculata PCC 9631]|uniref:Uncharacterized protein n=1 Tax=Planktothrix paucivesiculata PCC 9631 TaxID=671071 RepID=A0A7Z9BPN0_9CYAN|nr:hypothetical protein PL9631_450082 [Planktothrix paucivesiculata PCC 9631]
MPKNVPSLKPRALIKILEQNGCQYIWKQSFCYTLDIDPATIK